MEFYRNKKMDWHQKQTNQILRHAGDYRNHTRSGTHDLSCKICYPKREEETEERFELFWDWYQEVKTVQEFSGKTKEIFKEKMNKNQENILKEGSKIDEKEELEIQKELEKLENQEIEKLDTSTGKTIDDDEMERMRIELELRRIRRMERAKSIDEIESIKSEDLNSVKSEDLTR